MHTIKIQLLILLLSPCLVPYLIVAGFIPVELAAALYVAYTLHYFWRLGGLLAGTFARLGAARA